MARSCKRSDGRKLLVFGRWTCTNCDKTFESKAKFFNHTVSIFG